MKMVIKTSAMHLSILKNCMALIINILNIRNFQQILITATVQVTQ